MKRTIFLFALMAFTLAGLQTTQAQSIKKGKYIVSIDKPAFISVLEENFYGLHYGMKYGDMGGIYKPFRNEDGSKHKLKNTAAMLEYMDDKNYTLLSTNLSGNNKIYEFQMRTIVSQEDETLAQLKDAKEKLEFGIITQEEFNELKTELLEHLK